MNRQYYRGLFGVCVLLFEDEVPPLVALARGKRVLEVGSLYGGSAILMAQVAESVVCVDPFCNTPAGPGDPLPVFRYNVGQNKVGHKIRPMIGLSTEVCPLLKPTQFDLVFIDADHRDEPCTADIKVTLPLLKPGGIMAFHDYDPHRYPGVVAAVDRFRAGRGMDVHNTLAVVYC